MYKLAILGNPVAHSLSPTIWQLFAKQCDINLEYNKIHVELGDFATTAEKFFTNGGLAMNVTSPFKPEAFAFANNHSSRSLQTANLLIKRNQQIFADNTDGIGLVNDIIQTHNTSLKNSKVLIIGSGGVIHSILPSIIEQSPQHIALLMRDYNKLNNYQQYGKQIYAFDNSISYDIIINTTPNTADNLLFDCITQLQQNTLCYDMSYQQSLTLFLQKMQKTNPTANLQNGLGMLVWQAYFGFVEIFNQQPDVAPVYQYLKGLK